MERWLRTLGRVAGYGTTQAAVATLLLLGLIASRNPMRPAPTTLVSFAMIAAIGAAAGLGYDTAARPWPAAAKLFALYALAVVLAYNALFFAVALLAVPAALHFGAMDLLGSVLLIAIMVGLAHVGRGLAVLLRWIA
ncbi:MAG: hypothetical protein WDM91_05360 [Rhizomicrobium sp.]